MKTAAIIAEFNPFHNGHAEIIKRAKEEAGADYVIILMSGNYVQRGAPAILDRHTRCRSALLGGADLVIVQPTRFCTSSAEDYALRSVRLLNALGIVDFLVFGSECGDIGELVACAEYLSDEHASFRDDLRSYLKSGVSFPKARAMAAPQFGRLLSSPNNTLAVEYIKALIRTGSRIEPYTVQRVGAGHHARVNSDTQDPLLSGAYTSASAIREIMEYRANTSDDMYSLYKQELFRYIPEDPLDTQIRSAAECGIVKSNDFSLLLAEKIWEASSPEHYLQFANLSPDLARTIYRNREECRSFDAFAEKIKHKSLTRTHIDRALLHITLSLKAGEDTDPMAGVPYAHVLGCRKSAAGLLGMLSKRAGIPIITRPGVEIRQLGRDAAKLLSEETRVSNLYNAVRAVRMDSTTWNTLSRKFIMI